MEKIQILAKIPWLFQTNWISQKGFFLQVIFIFEDYLVKTRAAFAVLLIHVILSRTSSPSWLSSVALECQPPSGFQICYSTSTFGMNLSDRSNGAFNNCVVINLKICLLILQDLNELAKQFRILKRNLVQKENVTHTKRFRIPWVEEPYSDHLQWCTKWI